MRGGKPVRLGSRARELLTALTERPGILVKKGELIKRVWPDTVVEEGTLRVHVAALRRILENSQGGARYVENVTGQGYRFVARVTPFGGSTPQAIELLNRGDSPHSEQLRVTAVTLIENGRANIAAAEALLHRSMDAAHRHGTPSWEARSAISLARLWQEQGRTRQACHLLASLRGRLSEDFDTDDLPEVDALLQELSTVERSVRRA